MTVLDYILLGTLVIAFILGFIKGLVKMIVKMFSLALVLFLTITYIPKISPNLEANGILGYDLASKIETKVDEILTDKLGEDADKVIEFSAISDKELKEKAAKMAIEECLGKMGVPKMFTSLVSKVFLNENMLDENVTMRQIIVPNVAGFIFKCICYVSFFALALLLVTIIGYLIIKLFTFGLLSIPNRLAGGVFALILGVVFVNVVFLIFSALQGVIPPFQAMVEQTQENGLEITKYFYNNNWLLQILSKSFDLEKSIIEVFNILKNSR